MDWLNHNPYRSPLLSELRKDCIYIIMVPTNQRQDFMKAIERLDLSQGPEILIIDEMQLTIMEFSKEGRETNVIKLGKPGK